MVNSAERRHQKAQLDHFLGLYVGYRIDQISDVEADLNTVATS